MGQAGRDHITLIKGVCRSPAGREERSIKGSIGIFGWCVNRRAAACDLRAASLPRACPVCLQLGGGCRGHSPYHGTIGRPQKTSKKSRS
jgi:hypothetical protein